CDPGAGGGACCGPSPDTHGSGGSRDGSADRAGRPCRGSSDGCRGGADAGGDSSGCGGQGGEEADRRGVQRVVPARDEPEDRGRGQEGKDQLDHCLSTFSTSCPVTLKPRRRQDAAPAV